MDLLCITDAVKKFAISSKTLRYYEQVGILKAERINGSKYRYYDIESTERIKQILTLRKMQISIKDIIRIYESADMSVIVEVFVNRIQTINNEIDALSELKRIVNEFLKIMTENGIAKISALPLLYEKMENIERPPITYEELSALSEKLRHEINLSVVDLPPMRMLSSKRKDNGLSDSESFMDWLILNNIPLGLPGRRELFELQEKTGETVFLNKIRDDLVNGSPYADIYFNGGLFAVGDIYVDEDISAFYHAMIDSFNYNKYYKVDYLHDGNLRHESFVEAVISPDGIREKVNIYLAVNKRSPDVLLYDSNKTIGKITVREIEEANPILWTKELPINGEKEYLHWVNKKIATGVSVKYPFRVDIEFRIEDKTSKYAWDSESGTSCVCFKYGDELYGVNMGNTADKTLSNEAIAFNQPIIKDYYSYKKSGRINIPNYNCLTWIIGAKHFAVIINNEVRYCGIDFPYMKMDLALYPPYEIIVDSHGVDKVFFRKITVSQLKAKIKINLKKGELIMVTRQSNNQLTNIRGIINGSEGKNYAFDDCMTILMEKLGEPELNYWVFAGITGDSIAQVYNRNQSTYCEYCVSGYLSGLEYVKYVFDAIGYEHTYVTAEQINANKTMYLQTLMAYIDKGIPVMVRTNKKDTPGVRTDVLTHFVYAGYEDNGKTLLFLWEESGKLYKYDTTGYINQDWVFAGEKKKEIEFTYVIKNAVIRIPYWLTLPEKNGMFFGPEAFRAWAQGIENGRYDNENDLWGNYSVYVSNLATNAGNSNNEPYIIKKFAELYPKYNDMCNEILKQYTKMSNQEGGIWKALEDLGGGFNVTQEVLRDKEKRLKIAEKLREAADCLDNVLFIIQNNLKED